MRGSIYYSKYQQIALPDDGVARSFDCLLDEETLSGMRREMGEKDVRAGGKSLEPSFSSLTTQQTQFSSNAFSIQ
jgi:hypothetical protein